MDDTQGGGGAASGAAGEKRAVVVEGVTRRYGDLLALDDLSFTLPRGELFGFLGPNGAGKTTTITVLTGQRRPDAGRVRVLGADPVADPVGTRRLVGVLPEREDPPSFLTPREYFQFVGRVREMDDGRVAARTDEWAGRLGFGPKLDTLTADLSRGQRQKVMLAGAFLHEPGLVFVDEPLANLDPIVQERVKAYLVDYVERGNTVFLSTHNIDVAEEVCTRVGVLREGRLAADRRPDDLGPGESLLDAFVADAGEPGALAGVDAPYPDGAGNR
jgi:ABC-2 type transport system ATP-binding protein